MVSGKLGTIRVVGQFELHLVLPAILFLCFSFSPDSNRVAKKATPRIGNLFNTAAHFSFFNSSSILLALSPVCPLGSSEIALL